MAKWNYIECCGYLVDQPTKIEKATFIRVALWQDEFQKANNRPTTYVDVAFFGKSKTKIDQLPLSKGTDVTFTGELTNKKDRSGISVIGLTGTTIDIIDKNDKSLGGN